MLSEESLQPLPKSSDPGDQTYPRSRRAILAGVAALVVIALLAVTLLAWIRANATTSVSTTGWQTYRDLLDLFSIQAPPDWSVQHDTTSGSYGDRTGSYSYTGEDVWLGVPPRNADGFGVWLFVEPLTTDFARQSTCSAFRSGFAPNTTLGGVPAYHDGLSMRMVDTPDAHFQVNAHYPGGPESPHSSPIRTGPRLPPLPLLPFQVETNRQTMTAVLASFTLTHAVAIECASA